MKRERITGFLADLQRQDGLLTEFDEALWRAAVESVTVQSEAYALLRFKDSSEAAVNICEESFHDRARVDGKDRSRGRFCLQALLCLKIRI